MPKWLKITLLLAVIAAGATLFTVWLLSPPPDPNASDPEVSLAMKWAKAGDKGNAETLKSLADKRRQSIVEVFLADRARLSQNASFESRLATSKTLAELPSGAKVKLIKIVEQWKPKDPKAKRNFEQRLNIYLNPAESGELAVIGARYGISRGRPKFSGKSSDDAALSTAYEWIRRLERKDLEYCSKAFNDVMDRGFVDYDQLPPNPMGISRLEERLKDDGGNLSMIGVFNAPDQSGFEYLSVVFAKVKAKEKSSRTIFVGLFRDCYWGAEKGKWSPCNIWVGRWQDWNPAWKSEEDCVKGLQAQFSPKGGG